MAVDASTPVGLGPVTGAIRKAAQATGTSFQYLLATAKVESDLNPNLTMRTSTATGLFQFIEQTWLSTLKQAGPAFGYGHYADAISRTPSGRYVVEDPNLRAEIMQLRKNPTANALMGGVFTQQNAAALATRLGRTPSEGELYIAHFFGPSGAAKAISLAQSNPNANAAEIFPAAARANQPIFYDKQGNARSIAGVCAELARRYQVARTESRATATAAVQPAPLRPPMPVVAPAVAQKVMPPKVSAAAAINQVALSPAAIPTALAFERDANAPVTAPQGANANDGRPMFHSLFQTGERREAIAPAISELWGAKTSDSGRKSGE
jgi:phage shock protein PspC (stress-responsive transcriptional regulator)